MANYERLSPGVYRGPGGALVHKGGRPINPQEARQMQGGRQVQMKPQPMGLPPQQQFDGMQSATRQDFNAGQAPMDEMGMSGHQFGSMRNQMGPSGAPPGAGPSGEAQRYFAGGSQNFNEATGTYRGPPMGNPGQQMRTADYVASRDGPFNGQGYGRQMAQQMLGQPPQGWAPPQQMPPQGMPARPVASAPPAGVPTKSPQGGGVFAGRKTSGVTGAPPGKRRGIYGGQIGG